MNATKIELMALPFVLALWPVAWAYAYWCIDTYWTWVTKQKPILSVTHTATMRIYVLRSPLTRKWLLSFTLPNPVGKHVTIAPRFVTMAIIAMLLWACNSPTNAPGQTSDYVSTVYVQDSLTEFKSCWHSWANDPSRDSLRIEGRKYTVSNRSRYRSAEEPVTFGDVGAEGAVILIDERFYLDTKGDTLVVLNKCGGAQ